MGVLKHIAVVKVEQIANLLVQLLPNAYIAVPLKVVQYFTANNSKSRRRCNLIGLDGVLARLTQSRTALVLCPTHFSPESPNLFISEVFETFFQNHKPPPLHCSCSLISQTTNTPFYILLIH